MFSHIAKRTSGNRARAPRRCPFAAAIFQTTAFEVDEDRIARMYVTRNPEKLARVAGPVRAVF